MTRAELRALLLSMLLNRPRCSTALEQAVADVAFVQATVDVIEKRCAEGFARHLADAVLLADAQRKGAAKA